MEHLNKIVILSCRPQSVRHSSMFPEVTQTRMVTIHQYNLITPPVYKIILMCSIFSKSCRGMLLRFQQHEKVQERDGILTEL
jgi:hypothetical protein